MASRHDQHLNLGYLPQITATQSGSSTADTSPIEPPSNLTRSPFGHPSGMSGTNSASRLGTGSPSHEMGGRLYPKRAREIQAQEGLATPNLWGPPASGGSTPLREAIPESPSQDGFPDFVPPNDPPVQPATGRRARAGTVPSRFSPGNGLGGLSLPPSLTPKTSRPTPATSPFRPQSVASQESANDLKQMSAPSASTLLSRLRAGSMPQRANLMGNTNPFASSFFTSAWGSGRERGSTLNSIRSSDGPDSPAQSSFSRDGLADTDVKTLDYLGLAETPQQSRATLAPGSAGVAGLSNVPMLQPFMSDISLFNRNINRYRSYSVNAKEKYAEDEEDDYGGGRYSGMHSGTMTPSAANAAAALAATQAQIHQHNLAVQAFANQASASRPRARTAGVLDSPLRNSTRGYLATPSRLDNSMSASDVLGSESAELDALPDAIRMLRLVNLSGQSMVDEDHGIEGPTRALWLGSIPTSTTVSSLQAIFANFGKIESTRVLVQKNCGFVNFEETECAIRAKAVLNGKEIFPGAGPVRIGYAKAPSASSNGTPGPYGAYPSPSPDPHGKSQEHKDDQGGGLTANNNPSANGVHSAGAGAPVPVIANLKEEMLVIVREFGANEHDIPNIAASIDLAINFDRYSSEIPTVPEPSHTRIHDAPKLREIRKRIDNNAITQAEIEEVAIGMLPEIAELSSDYLGNTVVQKLFEYCSEATKEAMLEEIAPHIAEIGVHKNGTWAAQKIIDVAKTPIQFNLIIDNLRPYAPTMFLDQYGNYVLQCCLRFGAPWNNFVFETMLSRLWDVSQGRFGARAMRACLESHHATKDQQRMLASAISLHSVQLATNANSALLLTWLLDTCNLPHRRTILAPRIVPHLVQLCTHKVAYLTVLKVMNQRNEPEARETIIRALFFSPDDKTLEDILSDQTCGPTLIHKMLTTPFWDESVRAEVIQNIRNVLTRLKVSPSQGYKRLMDEAGLSSRANGKADRDSNSNSPYVDRSRSISQQGSRTGQASMERQNSGPYPTLGLYGAAASLDASTSFDQFAITGSMFNAPVMNAQQLQFQSALSGPSSRNITPTNMYGNYASVSTSFDGFRPNSMSQQASPMNASPVIQPGGYPPPGFPPMMNGGIASGYNGYSQVPFYPQQQMQQQTGGRRGRQR